jgi:hypothetical protein
MDQDAIAAHLWCEMDGDAVENRCNLLQRGKSFRAGQSFRLNSVEKVCPIAAGRGLEGSMTARRIALSNSCKGVSVPQPLRSQSRIARMFQIVRLALDDNDTIAARRPLQPLFELWEDAVAMAEFDASRLWGDYGWDEERNCWWATDSRGARYRLAVETVASAEVAA